MPITWGVSVINREISEDGREVYFDHGAPFFSVSDTAALGYINEWKTKGLVAEWKENFGSFDRNLNQFTDFEKVVDTLVF